MWIELVWEPKPTSGIYKFYQFQKEFVFSPNPAFGGRWITNVDEAASIQWMLKFQDCFRQVKDGWVLKEDPEFVRTVLENADVVKEILGLAPVERDSVPLEDLDMSEIRHRAKAAGIPIERGSKKAEIIEALKQV